MNRVRLSFALAVVVVAAVAVTSNGASINLSVQYSGSFNELFEPLPGSPPAPLFPGDAPNPSGAPFAVHVPGAYHQFDVLMSVTGTTGSGSSGEDFQSVIFDMILGPGVTPSDVPWTGASYTYDPTGPSVSAPLLGTNDDAGVSPSDLKAITVIASSASSFQGTHFRHPGENEPVAGGGTNTALGSNMLLGSVFLFWDGSVDANGNSWVGVSRPENVNNPWSTVIGNVGTAQAAETMSVGPNQEWEVLVVPQNTPPSIISPLPVVGVSQGDILVGDFDATDAETPGGPFTFSGLALASFTPLHPAWPIPNPDFLSHASIDPDTGEVTWDTTGFRRGVYEIVANVSDQGPGDAMGALNNPGQWFVTIANVPEPSTLALFGLALVGCCGISRRRS